MTKKEQSKQATKLSISMHSELADWVTFTAATNHCSVSRVIQNAVMLQRESEKKNEPKEAEAQDGTT